MFYKGFIRFFTDRCLLLLQRLLHSSMCLNTCTYGKCIYNRVWMVAARLTIFFSKNGGMRIKYFYHSICHRHQLYVSRTRINKYLSRSCFFMSITYHNCKICAETLSISLRLKLFLFRDHIPRLLHLYISKLRAKVNNTFRTLFATFMF